MKGEPGFKNSPVTWEKGSEAIRSQEGSGVTMPRTGTHVPRFPEVKEVMRDESMQRKNWEGDVSGSTGTRPSPTDGVETFCIATP